MTASRFFEWTWTYDDDDDPLPMIIDLARIERIHVASNGHTWLTTTSGLTFEAQYMNFKVIKEAWMSFLRGVE